MYLWLASVIVTCTCKTSNVDILWTDIGHRKFRKKKSGKDECLGISSLCKGVTSGQSIIFWCMIFAESVMRKHRETYCSV